MRGERQNKRPFYKCLSPIESPGYGGKAVGGQAGRQAGRHIYGRPRFLDQRIFHSSRRYSFSVNLCGL